VFIQSREWCSLRLRTLAPRQSFANAQAYFTKPGTGVARAAFCTGNLSCALGVAHEKEMIVGNLLHYALVFLVVALVAAAVGFGGVAGFAMEAARLLFWVFIILFVISLVAGLVRRA
jgi:uncharacterized membrane protein YtjA (UPF0391 family)